LIFSSINDTIIKIKCNGISAQTFATIAKAHAQAIGAPNTEAEE
jgi:hypothetical protein